MAGLFGRHGLKRATCKHCETTISYANGTTAMHKHLMRCKDNPDREKNKSESSSSKVKSEFVDALSSAEEREEEESWDVDLHSFVFRHSDQHSEDGTQQTVLKRIENLAAQLQTMEKNLIEQFTAQNQSMRVTMMEHITALNRRVDGIEQQMGRLASCFENRGD